MIAQIYHAFLDMIVNGTVRLTGGLTQYEGAVEVYLNSQWRSVCYDGWDELDAKVVCREINYLSTSIEVKGIISMELALIIIIGHSCNKCCNLIG